MTGLYSRHLNFERITNFRDIGGYPAQDGRAVAWRRLFRSGDFRDMTRNDLERFTGEIGVTSVIDLRSQEEVEKRGIGLLAEADIKYHNVSFIAGTDRAEGERLFKECTNMGEFYLYIIRHSEFGKRIVAALEIIANPAYHPLVFHCAIGKDRTGILAAVLLSILGVADDVIIQDYSLSESYMDEIIAQADDNPEIAEAVRHLPEFFWKAAPESMNMFLSTLRQEYGSVKDYLETQGVEKSLVSRLEDALLI